MAVDRPDIPPHVPQLIRHFPPELKRLIYEVDRKARLIRIFAIGHRREVYEELAARLREARRRK
jgi:hypothetical protein